MTNATCTDCGHPTDSQALDLCRSCEDRVQLVCVDTSDLPESATLSDADRVARHAEIRRLFEVVWRGSLDFTRTHGFYSDHSTRASWDGFLSGYVAAEQRTARREFRDGQSIPKQEPRP